ncbi:hypothetical protein D1007_18744 [Hordeum vulgare]|nr:hypothetical protein D1007_18744 [Hordeum vulgare]
MRSNTTPSCRRREVDIDQLLLEQDRLYREQEAAKAREKGKSVVIYVDSDSDEEASRSLGFGHGARLVVLPSELLGHIADCLLATNDVDCYMDFRAVCTSWRSAAEDPRSNPSDARFHPRRWILVDEVFQTDARLMVNLVTSRVVRKDLPLLRKYDAITTTPCGLFVLADLEPPHEACVLNPLTGHMIRFVADVPFELGISAAAFSGGSSPELVLLSDRCYEQYTAAPESKGFILPDSTEGLFPFLPSHA